MNVCDLHLVSCHYHQSTRRVLSWLKTNQTTLNLIRKRNFFGLASSTGENVLSSNTANGLYILVLFPACGLQKSIREQCKHLVTREFLVREKCSIQLVTENGDSLLQGQKSSSKHSQKFLPSHSLAASRLAQK